MSFSSRSHRTDDSYTKIPEEYDFKDRPACFYLYTRPLDDAILGHAEHIELYHWSLVAVFGDESVRTMEGTELGGNLVPSFFKEAPKETCGEKYYKLISMETSPFKLREVTRTNNLNGTTYSLNTNNCQNWVKAAARKISSSLSRALDNYKSNGELNMVQRAAKCSWASSRSSSKKVVDFLIGHAALQLEGNLEKHHLE